MRQRVIVFSLRGYVAVALVAASVHSPPALSVIPILLVLSYLYLWRRPINPAVNLLRDYFLFFAVAILLVPLVGDWPAFLISLPALLLVDYGLEANAGSIGCHDTQRSRTPTSTTLALLATAVLGMCLALLLGSLSLLLACVASAAYFAFLGVIMLHRLPVKPVEEVQGEQRMLAGAKSELTIELNVRTKTGGMLFLKSPYPWLKVEPDRLSLRGEKVRVKISLSPSLSGTPDVKLHGYAIDRWGLMQTSFLVEPLRLFIIPRARYAEWVANRYLGGTKAGTLSLMSNIEALRPLSGLRTGVEYYGCRQYQPGDSLKQIDWKHSLKHNELITREFVELHGQPVIVLINLAVGDEEQADKLAYDIIATAMSLARQDVPASLAAYNQYDVRVTTPLLKPNELVVESLKVAGKMVSFVNPVKYLSPPDVVRLRSNMARLASAESEASQALLRLLRLEYRSLEAGSKEHPATVALLRTMAKVNEAATVVIISHRNHDAEALAFLAFSLDAKGIGVINLAPGRKANGISGGKQTAVLR